MGGGWAKREELRINRVLANRLQGYSVAVDVQHLYRTGRHARDRGSVFTLPDGSRVAEGELSTRYAQGLVQWLKLRGARVLANDPRHGFLVGPYSQRHESVVAWGADAYLACHVNAGGGAYGAVEYVSDSGVSAVLANTVAHQLEEAALLDKVKTVPLAPGDRGFVCVGRLGAVPGVILEPFFGDYPGHRDFFPAPALTRLGETIGEGVARFLERRRAVVPA